MNKKFDIISMILIIALTIILVAFVFNYFTNSDSYEPTPATYTSTMVGTDIVEEMSDPSSVIVSTPFGEKDKDIAKNTSTLKNDDVSSSGDVKPNSGESIITDVYTKPPEQAQETTPLIITSNDNISDVEKKEVLKELDETLMDLLDVIENVKTVDESRLVTEEGEVQP